ncbi:MAG: PstS family phosphate ABC transporter substrate-binding protein [Candidatus Coatesbacteria bacterium]|nr:MAG: PstS family phosphate ABC transporter substrate-binding protein [Candidatus Coatesbacteria bacterium]
MVVVTAVGFFGCRGGRPGEGPETEGIAGEIQVKGSDTLLLLAQRWAEEFMAKNPEAVVQITGGGSGVGIAALIDGTTDVANSSRPIKDKEIEECEANGVEVVEFKVALDGISVIVNPENSVESLTLDQIKDIYTGKIKNWNELGGPDATIVCYGRQSSSGTYVYFKGHVLEDADYRADTQELQGNATLCDAVARDVGGIAYVGVGYAAQRDDVKVLGVMTEKGAEPVEPTDETVANGTYPISRYLYNYTDGKPEGVTKAYLEFAFSDKGQKIVEEVEYIALPPDILREQRDKLK